LRLRSKQAVRIWLRILQGWAHFLLGASYYQRNVLDSAEAQFNAIAENPYSVHIIAQHNGMFGLALTRQAQGEAAGARQIIDIIRHLDIERQGIEDEETRSFRARLSLLQGDLESAARWADAFTEPLADHPLLWLEEPHLTKA
jgi:hypothetical protein